MPAPQGLPHVACGAAAGIFGVVAVLNIASLALPWYEGAKGGEIINDNPEDTPLSSSVTLWQATLTVQVAPVPGETSTKKKKHDFDWAGQCSAKEKLNRDLAGHWPSTCTKVKFMQAMGFLGILIGAGAAGVLLIAVLKMILLGLIGAILGTVCTICVMAQCVFAAMISTSGIGIGAQVAGATLILSMAGVMVALYGAAKAVKAENVDPEEEMDGTRQERAEKARTAALEARTQLENNMKARQEARSAEAEKHAPVYLQEVLDWCQDENNQEEIPTDLLEAAFGEIDEDDSGCIEMDELTNALRECGLPVSDAAMALVMTQIDEDQSGYVDIQEFVRFFKNLEDLNDFKKKSERRAQFASFLLNCCFLVDIVVVGILLMVFIRLDPGTSYDDYVILKNILTVAGVLLAFLFLCVVGLPAARLTLGPPMEAYKKYYANSARRKKKAAPAAEPARPKEAFTVEVAPIQAELMVSSYRRVDQVQNMIEYSKQIERDNAMAAKLNTRRSTRGSRTGSKSSTGSGQLALAAGSAAGSGTVVSGDIDRYDKNAYMQAYSQMHTSRTKASFSALQVRSEMDTNEWKQRQADAMMESQLWEGGPNDFGSSGQLALGN
eukprot:TRINITY_DN45040_c0_g1_i1.p1 TRINITY_DN45040_c0_g1~~TRINITY_DN45040_c0_g1_i1.p1  ORF type:complete len:647 (-),score=118.32 TRINITY_DN45040_c0_g1_i1:47-1873(-)